MASSTLKIGDTFGFLTVIDFVQVKRTLYPICSCICGGQKTTEKYKLITRYVSSCGCKKGNYSHTPEYYAWNKIKQRCLNKNSKDYKDYGGRGIKVCKEWIDKEYGYINFINYMGKRPSLKHSIDRINVNGDYEPGNVRWATNIEQANNKRNTAYVESNGKYIPLKYFCLDNNMNYKLTHKKYKKRGLLVYGNERTMD